MLMFVKVTFTIGLLIFLSLPGSIGANFSCGPGFVWSGVAGACVQEICPIGSVGRDTRAACVCPAGYSPVFSDGLLEACRYQKQKPIKKVEAVETMEPEKEVEITPDNTESAGVEPVEVLEVEKDSEEPLPIATTTTPFKLSPAAAKPTTVTLLFLIAFALGYWLTKFKK